MSRGLGKVEREILGLVEANKSIPWEVFKILAHGKTRSEQSSINRAINRLFEKELIGPMKCRGAGGTVSVVFSNKLPSQHLA